MENKTNEDISALHRKIGSLEFRVKESNETDTVTLYTFLAIIIAVAAFFTSKSQPWYWYIADVLFRSLGVALVNGAVFLVFDCICHFTHKAGRIIVLLMAYALIILGIFYS